MLVEAEHLLLRDAACVLLLHGDSERPPDQVVQVVGEQRLESAHDLHEDEVVGNNGPAQELLILRLSPAQHRQIFDLAQLLCDLVFIAVDSRFVVQLLKYPDQIRIRFEISEFSPQEEHEAVRNLLQQLA